MKSLKELFNVKETSEILKDNKKFGLVFALIALLGGLLILIEVNIGPVFWFIISAILLVLFLAWLSYKLYDFDTKKPKKLGLYEAIFSLVFLLVISINSTFFAVISLVVVALSAIMHFGATSNNS